jgi:L-asparaginase/Glu-tRNA(Gln) amidotransferase subunit D
VLPNINNANPASPSQAMPAPGGSLKHPIQQTDVGHRVLVIYTGGTIGMKRTVHDGYIPASNFLLPYLRSSPLFNDSVLSPPIEGDLLTPLSRFGKHVPFKLHEFTPLLDSSDMNPSNWIAIAEIIEQNYDDFDAFVILHG